MRKEIVSKSPEETGEIAKDFISAKLIALYGDLGAGKTTFVRGLAKGLGIKKRIISPTFTIIKKFKIQNLKFKITGQKLKFFYHVDLYRSQNESDIKGLGLDEIIKDQENLVVIEWAERMGKLLPEKRIDIYFKYLDENKREITWSER